MKRVPFKYIQSGVTSPSGQPIFAMSFDRKVARRHLSLNATPIRNHVLKCIVFGSIKQEYVAGWIKELSEWFEDASEVKSKTALKDRDYRETVFSEFGDDPGDIRVILKAFRKEFCIDDKDPYPDFLITPELINRVYSAVIQLEDITIPLLKQATSVTSENWIPVLTSILEKK